MPESITLYTAKICPYAHRVELALAEAKADIKTFQIDLQNKPEWYAPQVNPASKVPAIAYGGPDVPPDQPSPESVKIPESLVLLEFVADLYPESNLLPKDPVLRSKVRLFIDVVSTKFVPGFAAVVARGESPEALLSGVEAIQKLLPSSGKFVLGDQYTIADASIAPFIARLQLSLKNDLGKFAPGEGAKILEQLNDPKFARFNTYVRDLFAKENFKTTFDEEYVKQAYAVRWAAARAQK